MIYKYIGENTDYKVGKNPHNFTKNKLYIRVKDRKHPSDFNNMLHQCILDNKGQYVVMMKTSLLEQKFIACKHILNYYYKLKSIFLW